MFLRLRFVRRSLGGTGSLFLQDVFLYVFAIWPSIDFYLRGMSFRMFRICILLICRSECSSGRWLFCTLIRQYLFRSVALDHLRRLWRYDLVFCGSLFIYGVCSILLFVLFRCVHVLRRRARWFWFYGVYQIGSRIFGIPICCVGYCTWFCCCILISFLVYLRNGSFFYRLYWSCYCGRGLFRCRSSAFYVWLVLFIFEVFGAAVHIPFTLCILADPVVNDAVGNVFLCIVSLGFLLNSFLKVLQITVVLFPFLFHSTTFRSLEGVFQGFRSLCSEGLVVLVWFLVVLLLLFRFFPTFPLFANDLTSLISCVSSSLISSWVRCFCITFLMINHLFASMWSAAL